jgi:manganese/zinc/iron transport system permease protein
VFTALFALGVFLVSKFAREVHLDLNHVLYGEIAFAPLNALLVGEWTWDRAPCGLWAS